jgi:hypothetical protein
VNRSVRWELRRPAGVAGELRGGTFSAAETAAEAEGEFTVVATAGDLQAEATVVVRTPDLSDLIARRTAGGLVQAQEEVDAFGESAAGVSASAAEVEEGHGWLWPLVGASVALILILLTAVLLFARRDRRRAGSEPSPDSASDDELAGLGGSEAAGSGAASRLVARACPVCHDEFDDPSLAFCPKDGSGLVETDRAPQASQPLICPTCRRGFAPGTRSCPTDGDELVPYALFVERHREQEAGPQLAKICPKCGDRYARQVTFCGKDGSELVLVN